MIPAITPPTDNLYKFIALFGLTIALFGVYNLGLVYDTYTLNQAKIEELKVDVRKKYVPKQQFPEKGADDYRHLAFRKLHANLDKVQELAQHASKNERLEINGKIAGMEITINALRIKLWSYLGIVVVGIFLMRRGFRLWKRKEQDLRDKMLDIEHAIKEIEREAKAKKKLKKKLKAAEVRAVTPEKAHVPEYTDQN